MKFKNITGSMISILFLVASGCGSNKTAVAEERITSNETAVSVEAETAPATKTETVPEDEKSSEAGTESGTASEKENIRTRSQQKYVHGDEGYFCLLDNVEYELKAQVGGTCWIYSSLAAMVTCFEKKTGRNADPDPKALLDKVFPDDAEDGFTIKLNETKTEVGGWAWLVTESLSNGFDGYVLDDTTLIEDFDDDAVKNYLREYGAVTVVVPDRDQSRQQIRDKYRTVNYITDNDEDYDHQIALVGWDDNFPKEYFKEQASADGAWIAYNSAAADRLYYISYDTKLKEPIGMSMSDEYTKVLSHDCGNEGDKSIKLGTETKVANVYEDEGTLGAIGIYNIPAVQDICIEIYDRDFGKLLYTQTAHMDTKGYHVIKLDENVDVQGFAVAVSFEKEAPVEGESFDMLDEKLRYTTVSHKAESFIYLEDSWLDLTEADTLSKLGLDFVPNNACLKALMIR